MPSPHSAAAAEIGRRIRVARDTSGATQEELAAIAHVDVGNLGRIERGASSPSVDTLIRLSSALRIDAADLVRGIDASMLPDKGEVFSVRDFLRERERRSGDRRR